MKALLVALGVLSAVGGVIMFMVTLANVPYGADVSSFGIVGAAYLLGGFAGGIIPWGIAEVIGRLEKLERR